MDTALRLVADGLLLLILLISTPILFLWLRENTWIKLPIMVMAGLSALLMGKILSLLYQPAFARPFLQLGLQPGAAYIDNPGFPSDHALLGTVVVLAVYAATRNKKLFTGMFLLVLVMGIGRVMALVHTPIDVIVGIMCGLAGSLWYLKLTK